MLRYQLPTYTVPMGGKWLVVSDSELRELEKTDHERYAVLDTHIAQYQDNAFSMFLPHGVPRKDRHKNDACAMLNDREHDLILWIGPNQCGKTFQAAARVISQLIPCDQYWPIFTEHGVDYHEWEGPKVAIVASWEWGNTYDVWEVYQRLLPRIELGKYAPNYGNMYDRDRNTGEQFLREDGNGKVLTRGFKTGTQTLRLKCGSRIIFQCYKQNISAWAGKQCDIAHLDEQCPEDMFDELSQRQITRGDYCPVIMSLTGHVVDGRPDTGAAGWIKRKLIDGGITKGRKFKQYKLSVDSVPDAIIPRARKEALYRQWVLEPRERHDEKKIREGEARYLGGWEIGGGAIISAFNPEIHMIAPFELAKYKPTYYRMIDHGENPCAVLLIALMPWGDAVCFKEYYEFGNSIAKNCTKIVEELCGNQRVQCSEYTFEGQTWPIYTESQTSLVFAASEMDTRSFGAKLKESGRTLGAAYNHCGLQVSRSSGGMGTRDDGRGVIALLCEWFELDLKRQHINSRIGRKTPEVAVAYGAPRMYMFDTLKHFRKEIEGWCRNPDTGKPIDKDDHLISCAKFFTARNRPYFGEQQQVRDAGTANYVRSEYTGY